MRRVKNNPFNIYIEIFSTERGLKPSIYYFPSKRLSPKNLLDSSGKINIAVSFCCDNWNPLTRPP